MNSKKTIKKRKIHNVFIKVSFELLRTSFNKKRNDYRQRMNQTKKFFSDCLIKGGNDLRTRRKLLNSALILGLTLGNLNDIVVQAVTAFHELGPIQSRQARTTTNEREKRMWKK